MCWLTPFVHRFGGRGFGRARWWVALGVLVLWLAPCGVRAQATFQPRFSWQYELQIGPAFPAPRGQDFYDLVQLSPTRLVAVGWMSPDNRTDEPQFLFIGQNGDTVTRRLPQLHTNLRYFERAVALPDHSFVTITGDGRDSMGRGGLLLSHFDSLGNPGWNRAIYYDEPTTGLPTSEIHPGSNPLALPDGYLLTADYRSALAGGILTHGCIIKTDRRGNPLQHHWLADNDQFSSYAETPIGRYPDGSYVVVSQSVSRVTPPQNVWDFDWHLQRITSQGDTLHTAYWGSKRTLERAWGLAATPDGGVIISGDRTPYAPQQSQRVTVAVVVKFDSLLRRQWQVRRPANYVPGGCNLEHVYPLQNGHYLAGGYTAMLDAGSTTAYHYEGLYVEIAPPASPTDTLGRIVAEWRMPVGWCYRLLPQAGDSTAYVYGAGQTNWGRTYFGKLAGLVPPAELNLCARPPVLPVPTYGPLVGSTLPFALDSSATTAGPRYGQVSRVAWDFGDGSPTAEGWQVQHTFASPQPVRVRVCVTNNLWCQTCAELYPLGPVQGVRELLMKNEALKVWPNPSGDGRFRLSLPPSHSPTRDGSARLVVTDALGRVVWRGEWDSGTETVVDLAASAAGVYGLRVQWPDGRVVTRKLVR